jgi:hypothetical protein
MHGTQRILLAWLSVVLGIAACGETARKPKAPPSAGSGGEVLSGGSSGEGGAGGQGPGSAAGWTSLEAGVGGHDSSAGAGGEGGAGSEPLPDHGLTFLPALPAPQVIPPGVDVHADDELTFSLDPRAVSADGSLVIGVSTVIFRHRTGPISYKHQELAVWTAAAGTKAVPLQQANPTAPVFPYEFCVAENGSSFVVSPDVSPTSRWTPQNGLTSYAPPNGFSGLGWTSCSADGKRASFLGTALGRWNALYWQEVDGAAPGAVTLPEGQVTSSSLLLSLDGPGGVLNVTREPSDPAPTVYRWSAGQDSEALLPPDGATCQAFYISGDGAVLAGRCWGPTISSGAFRWSVATGLQLLEADSEPIRLSRDGSTLLGWQLSDQSPQYNKLYAWRGAGAGQLIDVGVESWEVVSLSHDGAAAYVQSHGGELEAFKWTAGSELGSLAKLPGFASSRVIGASQDGSLAVGLSAKPGDSVDSGVAVLWDEQGARDIVAELTAAQVHLKGAQGFVPQRVWPGSPIRMQGYCLQPDADHKQTWFAELPAR